MKKMIQLILCVFTSIFFILPLASTSVKGDDNCYVTFDFENLEYNFTRNIIEGTDVLALQAEAGFHHPSLLTLNGKIYKQDGTFIDKHKFYFPVEWDYCSYDSNKKSQILSGTISFGRYISSSNTIIIDINSSEKVFLAKVSKTNMDALNKQIHLTLNAVKQDSEHPEFLINYPQTGVMYPYTFSIPLVPGMKEIYCEYSIDSEQSWAPIDASYDYDYLSPYEISRYSDMGMVTNMEFFNKYEPDLENGLIPSLHYRLRIVTDTKTIYSTSMQMPITLNKIDNTYNNGGDRGDTGSTQETPILPAPSEMPIKNESNGPQNNEVSQNVETLNKENVDGQIYKSIIDTSRERQIAKTKNASKDLLVSPGMLFTLGAFVLLGGGTLVGIYFKKKRY